METQKQKEKNKKENSYFNDHNG